MIDYLANPHGGTETQLFHILHRLDRSRFQPFLCCLWPTPWMQNHVAPCDHTVLFPKPIRWFSTPFSIIRLRNFLRSERFDIVHTFFPTSNVLGVLAAQLSSIPTILSSRRDLGYWKKSRDTITLRAVRNMATCYLANSYAVKRQTAASEGIVPHRIMVVHNGVDVRAYGKDFQKEAAAVKMKYHVPEDSFVVGAVANYHRRVKGIQHFVEAAKLVAAEMANVFFFIVGSGQAGQESALRRRIGELGLDSRFILAGPQEDVRPFLSMFHVGVLPSLSEGFSNSLLEYMAAGLPSVVSDVGGNREAIADGQSGFLVRPGSRRALAEKIVLLLKDLQLRERIAMNARRTVKDRFSAERMVAATERLYENLASRGPHKRGAERHQSGRFDRFAEATGMSGGSDS